MIKPLLLGLVLSLPLSAAASVPLVRADGNLGTPVWHLAQKGEISKSQAAAIAQKQHGGKVLSVSRQGDVYRVKLLKDSGRVKIVTVSAQK